MNACRGVAATNIRHLEYFADHVRVEHLLFDAVVESVGGTLSSDLTRPGMGLELRVADAQRDRTTD